MLEIKLPDLLSAYPVFDDLRNAVIASESQPCSRGARLLASDIVCFILFELSNAQEFSHQFDSLDSMNVVDRGIELYIYDLLLQHYHEDIMKLWTAELGVRPTIIPMQ